jgi:hypothetical protein
MTVPSDNAISPVPTDCDRSMDRLQRLLDGELPVSAFDCDPHAASCQVCRERIAAARIVLGTLASSMPATPPRGLSEAILAAVDEDRFAQRRRRSFVVAGAAVIAIAASILVTAWMANPGVQPEQPPGMANSPDVAKVLPQAPEPRPARLSEEFARVGQAIMDSSKPITEPVAGAPALLDILGESFALPAGPSPGFEPARDALAELPAAARTGLEPVTWTTQRAFARLMRDIGTVQVRTDPKR